MVNPAAASLRSPSLTESAAWAALEQVLDPEVPVLSVVELGIVRAVAVQDGVAKVVLTPTYSGCPATEVIEDAVVAALRAAGAADVTVQTRLAPPWTTDWLAPGAADKLRAYGIAPPDTRAPDGTQPLRFHPRLHCPRCGSARTELLSAFGSTACKSMHRCLECREPFEYFKPH